MNYPVTPQLLHKYIDGQCTAEEVLMLQRWYDSFEDQEDPFDSMTEDEQQVLQMLMLDKFKASIGQSAVINIEPTPGKHKMIKVMVALSGIAALLLVVWGVYFRPRPATSTPNSVITTASDQMVLNNQTNSIFKQVLSDGSIVWLSPKSQLEYPKKFIGTFRQVKMSGEAFFEVSKDHAHPFIIYSGGVITRVWGTSFRIRAFKNIPTEVSVVTGKVSVELAEKNGSEVMLFPKQKVVYSKNSGLLTVGKETIRSNMRIWQKTSIAFDDMPLDQVLTILNKKFGTRIYTNDKELSKLTFHADLTDQNLASILDILEGSLNVSYNMEDIEIELYRKPQTN